MSDVMCEVCGRPLWSGKCGRGPDQTECSETGGVECGIAARLAVAEARIVALTSLLDRWLLWEGRSNDEREGIEVETAKVVGHTDECELLDYGVCTCERATPGEK